MGKVIEINCETGEVTERDQTPEEIAQHDAQAQAFAEEQAKRDAEAKAKADARASAEAKLAAQGWTPEEIASFRV